MHVHLECTLRVHTRVHACIKFGIIGTPIRNIQNMGKYDVKAKLLAFYVYWIKSYGLLNFS